MVAAASREMNGLIWKLLDRKDHCDSEEIRSDSTFRGRRLDRHSEIGVEEPSFVSTICCK